MVGPSKTTVPGDTGAPRPGISTSASMRVAIVPIPGRSGGRLRAPPVHAHVLERIGPKDPGYPVESFTSPSCASPPTLFPLIMFPRAAMVRATAEIYDRARGAANENPR